MPKPFSVGAKQDPALSLGACATQLPAAASFYIWPLGAGLRIGLMAEEFTPVSWRSFVIWVILSKVVAIVRSSQTLAGDVQSPRGCAGYGVSPRDAQ
jgi:hypothetical protein